MTITWSYGGTALSTYGVVTLIGDYLDIANRRSENIALPFQHGRVHVDKFYDERKVTIGLAITSDTPSAQEATFDALKTNFSSTTQKVLSYTMSDTSTRNAYATIDTPLQVEWINDAFARVIVEFTLADPFFRSSVATTDNTTTIGTTDTTMSVINSGTVEERNPTILLTGPLSNVTISTTDGVTMTYTGSISSTDTVTIGILNGEFYATHSASGSVIGNVSHAGSSSLLVLPVGTNTLHVYTTTTGGSVKITFYPPFL